MDNNLKIFIYQFTLCILLISSLFCHKLFLHIPFIMSVIYCVIGLIISYKKTGIIIPKLKGIYLSFSEEKESFIKDFKKTFFNITVEDKIEDEEELRNKLKTTISNRRNELAMTQAHLAQCSCVSVRTVQRLESTGRVSYENLRSICSVLEIVTPLLKSDSKKIEPIILWKNIAYCIYSPFMFIIFPPSFISYILTLKSKKATFIANLIFGLVTLFPIIITLGFSIIHTDMIYKVQGFTGEVNPFQDSIVNHTFHNFVWMSLFYSCSISFVLWLFSLLYRFMTKTNENKSIFIAVYLMSSLWYLFHFGIFYENHKMSHYMTMEKIETINQMKTISKINNLQSWGDMQTCSTFLSLYVIKPNLSKKDYFDYYKHSKIDNTLIHKCYEHMTQKNISK